MSSKFLSTVSMYLIDEVLITIQNNKVALEQVANFNFQIFALNVRINKILAVRMKPKNSDIIRGCRVDINVHTVLEFHGEADEIQ